MKYLFFDLEMAHSNNGGKICEFGYVVTNEYFEIVEKDNFIINPDIKKNEWDWYVLENILTRPREDYESRQKFNYFYPKIKSLIEEVDYIFGHSIDNDVKVLNTELKNYNYEALTFDFYDVKNVYKEYKSQKRDVSLETISEEFEIKLEGNQHDALYDSMKAMLELKYMINHLNLTIEELLELCPSSKFKCENYKFINFMNKNSKQRDETYKSYVKRTKVNKDVSFNRLYGKRIYIKYMYTKKYPHQSKNLVKLIHNIGGEVVLKVSESNIYVEKELYDSDNNVISCISSQVLQGEINSGKKIEIIEFNNLLSILNLTLDDLNNKKFYSDFIMRRKKKNKQIRNKKLLSITLGELINDEEE